jgi:hypothetical protein
VNLIALWGYPYDEAAHGSSSCLRTVLRLSRQPNART